MIREKDVTRKLITSWRGDGWIVIKHTDAFCIGIPDLELKKQSIIIQCELKVSQNVKITDIPLDYGRKKNKIKGFITGPQVQFLRNWSTPTTPAGCLVVTPEGWLGVGALDLEMLWTVPLESFGQRFVRGDRKGVPVLVWPTVRDIHEAFLFRG